jgi:hypothetical protein
MPLNVSPSESVPAVSSFASRSRTIAGATAAASAEPTPPIATSTPATEEPVNRDRRHATSANPSSAAQSETKNASTVNWETVATAAARRAASAQRVLSRRAYLTAKRAAAAVPASTSAYPRARERKSRTNGFAPARTTAVAASARDWSSAVQRTSTIR